MRIISMYGERGSSADRSSISNLIWTFIPLFCVVVAFLPLFPPVDPLHRGFTVGRVFESAMLLLCLAICVLLAQIHRLSIRLSDPSSAMLWVFLVWCGISAIWSPNRFLTISKAVELGILTLSALLLGEMIAKQTDYSIRAAIDMVGNALLACLGVLLLVNVIIWGRPLPIVGRGSEGYERYRLVLAHAHPLYVADFLSLLIVFVLLTRFRISTKILLAFFLGYCLLLTDSRAAPAALVLAAVGIATFRVSPTLRWTSVYLLTWVVIGYVALTHGNVTAPLSPFLSEDVYTLSGRTDLWSYAITIISEHLATGVGYFGSRFWFLNSFPWAGHAHNAYLEILLATGVPGFALLVTYLGTVVTHAVRLRSQLLLGLFLFTLISGMNNPMFFVPNIPMFLLILSFQFTTKCQQRISAHCLETDSHLRGPMLSQNPIGGEKSTWAA